MLILYALHCHFYCNLLDLVECDSSAFGEFRLRQLQRFFHLCSFCYPWIWAGHLILALEINK